MAWNTPPPAGGADTHIQYNTTGALTGEAAFTYDPATDRLAVPQATVTGIRVTEVGTIPAAPTAGNVELFAFDGQGLDALYVRSPAGPATPLQRHIGLGRTGWLVPAGGVNTAPTGVGFTVTAGSATLTARTPTATNTATRLSRLGYVSSAATAGTIVSIRHAGTRLFAGNGTAGGFVWVGRFMPSDAAAVAGARQFYGISSATGAPTNVEPNTLTNSFGIGSGAADTTLSIYFGAATAGTPVALGANFPANTLSTDAYELVIAAPPAGGATWRVTRLNTGDTATGTLTAGQIPASTTALSPLRFWRTNNATALAVAFDLISVYFDDYNA
jgi:hypothetical protein